MEIKKKQISAQIVADSINPQGDRITTFLLTYPRFIHGELMTHRVFSRNSASSRAIPFKKMVKMVEEDPFIPIAWQKDHKGMQGVEYLDKEMSKVVKDEWLIARNEAIRSAKILNEEEFVTKQLCNRLLEPFMWHTVLVTATEYDNFFELRCPQYEYNDKFFKSIKEYHKEWCTVNNEDTSFSTLTTLEKLNINKGQAEIHIMDLAEKIYDAMNESTPKQLKSGQWHIPFGDKVDYSLHKWNFLPNITELWGKDMCEYGIKVATARCARLSYMTFDGEIDYNKDIELHDMLLQSGHYSPFEHCARTMTDEEYTSFIKGKSNANWNTDLVTDDTYEISAQFDNTVLGWCNNFKGFIPYRYLIENNIKI